MNENVEPSELELEEESIKKAGKINLFHWLVVVCSLGLTLFAWNISKNQTEQSIKSRFEQQAQQVVELVSERMLKYEDALWGGVGAIQAQRSGEISYDLWLKFASSIQIEEKYPGINGIGVIYPVKESSIPEFLAQQRKLRPNFNIHPKHNRGEYLPITYVEPESTNKKAVGLDMAHEDNRYSAAIKARDTGVTQITGPITLVQDKEKTPGFLFYAPYYNNSQKTTLDERRKNFEGIVYAPFIVNKLMAGTLSKSNRQVGVSIKDKGEVIFDEHNERHEDFDPNPMYKKSIKLELYGRTWIFDIWSAQSFRKSADYGQSQMILLGGIIIDSLLFLLFVLLTKANRRAISFAQKATGHLRKKTSALERSNKELEKFAYITSHDLRSPIRGIGDLADYIEEDLDEILTQEDSSTNIKYNLSRIRKLIQRMEGLIKGILDFSSVGQNQIKLEDISLREIIIEAIQGTGVKPSQISIESKISDKFKTDAMQLSQVFSNLFSNAKKYSNKEELLSIKVNARENESYYLFSVKDNGPGIDRQFHSKVFEPFQTLQPRDRVEATGIGLSIVKKIIENYGGKITLESNLGEGTMFTFEWPREIDQDGFNHQNEAA